MLEHIIRSAKAEGFHEFIIAVHYLGHVIEDYFSDGNHLGVKINYLREESHQDSRCFIANVSPRKSLL